MSGAELFVAGMWFGSFTTCLIALLFWPRTDR